MNKVKLFLTILSIFIAVTPISTQIFLYRDNPVDLILPPSVAALLAGETAGDLSTADSVDFADMSFPLPILIGDPVLLSDNTVKLAYTFTNPMDGKITLNSISAILVCTDHDFTLSDNMQVEPVTLEPHETANLNVTCTFTNTAIEHIKTHHKNQDSIHTEFKNFRVDLTDISIAMPHRKVGSIQIPLTTLTINLSLW